MERNEWYRRRVGAKAGHRTTGQGEKKAPSAIKMSATHRAPRGVAGRRLLPSRPCRLGRAAGRARAREAPPFPATTRLVGSKVAVGLFRLFSDEKRDTGVVARRTGRPPALDFSLSLSRSLPSLAAAPPLQVQGAEEKVARASLIMDAAALACTAKGGKGSVEACRG